ncbi:HAMP domain-containing sensor histidine kinase [Actinocorallia sp. A-T 12471]|uniref:sensor histidine kinase n=1 Tax=Actinocorallia sp. A-T 12471 TaxID=3089813 RepID=UPI0029D3D316|nr:HAMP domain-containing sensor histidine kinase [Actinocorallia sp. A-T 12471]MDX6738259.1 HAMP domain-containing sensor histidine kinase [Actinocorallia sp. A-T 12471]
MRGRVTGLAVTVSLIVLSVCALLLLALIRQDAAMKAAATAAHTSRSLAVKAITERLADPIERTGDQAELIQVVGVDGRVLAATPALRGHDPLTTARPADPDDVRIDTTACPKRIRGCLYVVGFHVASSAYEQPVTVYAAVELPGILGDGSSIGIRVLILLVLLVSLIGFGTWVAIGAALRPVEEITDELADITASDLSRRVPVHYSGGGEVQKLAETVNGTLHRLEQATDRQRRFVAEASHDLRNPIAGMLTRLEVLDGEDEDYPWKEVVHEAVHDAERLSAIVEDLLELARLEAGSAPPTETLDLGALVRREIAQRPPDALPITTDLVGGVWVRGSPLRLARVLENLLANAVRHGRSGVRVQVRVEDGDAVMGVYDDGDGVPEADRERIFERFARLKESRERDSGGTGLGLPIAREIARNYGGSLAVAEGEGGRFELRLPIADPPEPQEPPPEG